MIATILVALAVWALMAAINLRRRIPQLMPGKLIYSDTDRHDMPNLVSHRYGLTGKPDYAYRHNGITTPVEVKKKVIRRHAPRPWDVWQLMAYCVLLEESGATVQEGVVEYQDQRFNVPYDWSQKRLVLVRMERIKKERRAGMANRDHQDGWRCQTCGVRESCDQRLV
jgi:CRISPR-associated exonuclease Cas4